ncbi:MAG TPA: UDP-N-acetylglucosamine 2-epimerase (non-hydrolyzing) [Burkholderiaceae bacterium]|nr:UDP-N-acetylglucosamine 2-epimerase (non-hydrolyzing) [Burkholderiaceae bacterium]
MKTITTILGARPQFIKAAAVSRAIKAYGGMEETIVHTGQHYDPSMSDVFFKEMDIPQPQHQLSVGGGTHGVMTGEQLKQIEAILLEQRPDCVLVYGDTNSTLAGALAAVKLHIPVAHVEAGLRSFNRRMPEEVNRVLTDHMAQLHFAPTETACRHLRKEGISGKGVHLSGDVMMDAALFYGSRARQPEWFDELKVNVGAFLLCTIHRAENTDSPTRLRNIFRGLAQSERPIILPLHPRTRKMLEQFGIQAASPIHVVEPVGYLEMTWLETNCAAVVTDSGGVQKEAFFHGKPCITLRDETEWTELVELGANTLVGADAERIALSINQCAERVLQAEVYGDGRAAQFIAKVLSES